MSKNENTANTKKTYTAPAAEVILFGEDIIVTSNYETDVLPNSFGF